MIIIVIIIKLTTVAILLNWPPSNSRLMSVWGSACKPLKMSQLMFPLLRITLLKKGAIINKNRLPQLTWWCNYHYVIDFSLTFTYFNIIILFWALYLSMHCEASFFFPWWFHAGEIDDNFSLLYIVSYISFLKKRVN